jgi:hypothetical protein
MIIPVAIGAFVLLMAMAGGGGRKREFAKVLAAAEPDMAKLGAVANGEDDPTTKSIMENLVHAIGEGQASALPGMKTDYLGALVMALYQHENRPAELRAWARVLRPYGTKEAVGVLLNKAHALKEAGIS